MPDGFDLLCAGRIDEAIAAYTRVIEVEASPLVLANRALAHVRRRDFTAAMHDYQAADALDPPHLRGDAYPKRIGAVLWMMGRRQHAIEQWERVVDLLGRRAYAFTDAAGGVQSGALLWFGALRLDDDERMRKALGFIAKRTDSNGDGWPKPIARFVLGEIDAVRLRASAANGDSLAGRRLCQACFYAGVAARTSSRQAASALLAEAVAHGADVPLEIEYDLAVYERQFC
jgi:tetratricopeptide (TPR) repeat protein